MGEYRTCKSLKRLCVGQTVFLRAKVVDVATSMDDKTVSEAVIVPMTRTGAVDPMARRYHVDEQHLITAFEAAKAVRGNS